MKKALALLLVGMMATAGVAQASEVMENEGAVFEEAPLETTEHMYYQDNKKPFYVNNQPPVGRFRAVRSGVSEKLFALRGALVQAEGLFEAARADSWYIRGACSVVVSLRCVDAGRRNWFNREGFLASPSRHGGVDCVCSVCWGSEGRAFLFGSFL